MTYGGIDRLSIATGEAVQSSQKEMAKIVARVGRLMDLFSDSASGFRISGRK